MLSNKLTFSLASLVVLLVFAFGVTPVMAHSIKDDPDTAGTNEASEHVGAGAHAQVQSITVSKNLLKAGDKFKVEVAFEAAKEEVTTNGITTAHAISNPTAALTLITDLSFLDSDGTAVPTALEIESSRTVRGAADGVGAVYELTVMVPDDFPDTSDGTYTVGLAAATNVIPDGVNQPKITIDTTAPTVTLTLDGSEAPTAKQSEDFTLRVQLNERISPDDLEIEITPSDKASHGSLDGKDREDESGGHMDYDLPIMLAENLMEAYDGTLTVTVTATDGVGQEDEDAITVSVMIAAAESAPAAPAALEATAGVGKITVSWTAVTGTTYEYSKDGGTTWMDATSPLEVTGPAGTAISVMVRVKESGNVPAGMSGTASATPTTASDNGTGTRASTPDGAATSTATEVSVTLAAAHVAEGQFIVLANAPGAADIRTPSDDKYSVFTVDGMGIPDLEDFFIDGGAIDVVGPTNSKTGDIVISEIMWGSDEKYGAANAAMRRASQWIELYVAAGGTSKGTAAGDTTNTGAIPGPWKLVFSRSVASNPAAVTDSVDRMSNWGLGKWSVVGGGHGSNGRTRTEATTTQAAVAAVPFVSTYRNINYTDLRKTDKTRADQLAAIPNGTRSGSWKEDSANRGIYQMGLRYATPGGQHVSGIISEGDTTAVARDGVVFNEVANRSKDGEDWLELYNKKKTAVKINGWQLSTITSNSAENVLFEFKSDEDITIPGNGFLVIVNTDPASTSLSVGQNIDDPSASKQGVDALYYQNDGLKIPKTAALLMLRSGTDKNKTHEKIVDVAAINGGFFAKSDKDFNTDVWPLKSTAAGAKDDLTENDAKTWIRDQGKALFHGDAWKPDGGVTGVGIDRNADAFNSGTPGYANDAVQGEFYDADAKAKFTGMVSISEIMVDQGRRNLPQWIELFNSSRTQGVNIKGWELKILNVNSADLDARVNSTIRVDGDLIIPPSETALIVSSTGRYSRDNIPTSSIYNLHAKHKKDLEMTSQRDSVLSAEGFYISLSDARDVEADAVGNIDGNPKTDDTPAWTLPKSEDTRSSLIRVYVGDGTPDDGTAAEGWKLAAMTNLVPQTYYGDPDDMASPGDKKGSPLPVSLSSFRPVRDKATGAVVIRWITESELDNAGFNILRSETKNGEYKVVNLKGIISGHGTTSEKHTYEWTDTTAKPNVVYYYQIEDVSLDGKRTTLARTHLRGNVTAAGKATTTWADLKTLRK